MIGAVGPWGDGNYTMLWRGIEMAVSEINAEGGIGGRKIKIVREDDESDVSKAQRIAQRLAEDTSVVAVLGHVESYVSNAVSVLYEHYGLLMITPLSTSPRLTQRGFDLVFRAIPDDEVFGTELADFCLREGLHKTIIYHIQNDYGVGLANAFEMRCEEIGLEVLDRRAYDLFSGPSSFDGDLEYWKENFAFDCIFIAGTVPQAAQFVKEARRLGIDATILGGDGLDMPELMTIAGEDAEGVFVGSTFHPDCPTQKAREFVRKFRERYGGEPSASAAQGYDCAGLFAHAVATAGSTVPSDMARALRTGDDWEGVTGTFDFDDCGDLKRDSICLKVVREGKLQYFTPPPSRMEP